jgi:UDPglucose 6-dehydrogenase
MKRIAKSVVGFILCLYLSLLPSVASAQNVTVIGIGRLGLCLALCLEKAGYDVLGVDVFPGYIEKINARTFASPEPKLVEYLNASRNFRATTSLKEGLDFADVYLIALSTTIGEDGYDFTALSALLTEMNAQQIANKHVVICSTIYPGYVRGTALPLMKDCKDVTLSYNPPFIAQGEIIRILENPDMVLIGEGSKEIGDILETMYKAVSVNHPYIARMSAESAEITKLAVNCFVTSKIAFANLVADIADETPGADKYAILNAVGKDLRVGSKYLMPGYGFGGPCFPRDNRGLGRYAISKGIDPVFFSATDVANDQHADFMAKKMIEQNLDTYVFEDVSYKANSPVKMIDASQKLAVARKVAESGRSVTLVDDAYVISQVKAKYGDLFTYIVK